MEWAPLCNYTHYSLLKGYSKPQQLAEKCKANGYKACGIADTCVGISSDILNHTGGNLDVIVAAFLKWRCGGDGKTFIIEFNLTTCDINITKI